ncbi:hypothetical protein N665_0982s0002 [Sinapis alba]|nr:hypothetical protein N665_0982s0002 [Sinapis alba]
MEASQEPNLPNYMKDDNVSQETKNLISSLPAEKDFMGYSLYNYKGCWYYPNTLQAVLDVQDHFQPQKNDIILASLPKETVLHHPFPCSFFFSISLLSCFPQNGVTPPSVFVFTISQVQNRQTRFVYHRPLRNLTKPPTCFLNPFFSKRFCFLSLSWLIRTKKIVEFLEIELYASSQTPDLAKFPSPMIFSTHMHLNALREATTKSSSSPCKIVYVCRGLKDTFVSGWHYKNMLHRTKMDQASFELMFDAYCRGVTLYGPYWEHMWSYWKGSLEDVENVLFMRYEEIIEEPLLQVKRDAEFLNFPFTKEEEESGSVEEILKLCSLRNLSNLEINKNGRTRIGIDSNVFFRKGEVGDWKNHLTSQMAKKFDEVVEFKLRGSGLTFQ